MNGRPRRDQLLANLENILRVKGGVESKSRVRDAMIWIAPTAARVRAAIAVHASDAQHKRGVLVVDGVDVTGESIRVAARGVSVREDADGLDAGVRLRRLAQAAGDYFGGWDFGGGVVGGDASIGCRVISRVISRVAVNVGDVEPLLKRKRSRGDFVLRGGAKFFTVPTGDDSAHADEGVGGEDVRDAGALFPPRVARVVFRVIKRGEHVGFPAGSLELKPRDAAHVVLQFAPVKQSRRLILHSHHRHTLSMRLNPSRRIIMTHH